MSGSRSVKSPWSRWTALVVVAGFAACVEDSVAPAPEATPPAEPPRVLGFAELTFTGIGTPELSSSMLVAPTIAELEALRAERERSGDLRDLAALDLTAPANANGSGNGTIQLRLDESSEFVFDSIRYLHATYLVRNAQFNGATYDTERHNLTFLAVNTNSAINETAVRKLVLGNGTPAPPALALEVLPTEVLTTDGTTLRSTHPDVMQIFTEPEVAVVVVPPAVNTVFPYGFIVRLIGSNTTRTLLASPAPGDFAGQVDFAFRIPEQSQPADDPDTLTVLMLAVDDSQTRLTQGLQEQTARAREALQQLASTLNPDTVTLLPGGSLPGVTAGLRTLCSVRTAGTSFAPTAHLVNVDWSFSSFTPDPYATNGSASHIANITNFEVAFSAPVQGAGPQNFSVQGLQSGPAFLGQAYSGNGTSIIATPNGRFFFGEEIEISLTNAMSCPQPQVARYRVLAGPATGTFGPQSTYGIGSEPISVAIGDLNGDGRLDLAVANSNGVSVLLNNGNGTFPAQNPTYGAGNSPSSVAIGDLNGDGRVDLAVADLSGETVSVLLNNGDGTFPAQNPEYHAGSGPESIAIGDLNGDGRLDLATANVSGDVSILLNNGDGTFPARNPRYGAGNEPTSIAIGDLNGDGSVDLAVANVNSTNVSVLLNNGDGTFPAQNPTYGTGESPQSVAIGDLNNDGSLDLAVANNSSNNVSVLMNNGDGTFSQNPTYRAGNTPWSVAIGDLNGDGSLDLAVANLLSDDVSVLLNNGDGTFPADNPRYSTGNSPFSVAIGDLGGGDGSLDLAVANGSSEDVSVLLGQMP